MFKRVFQNGLLVLATLTLCFVAWELAFRAFGRPGAIYDYDPATGLGILIPKNRFTYTKSCLSAQVSTNAAGFHDREFIKEKAPGVIRIAVIGDSFVQAMEVAADKAFPKLLESALKTEAPAGVTYEVYAFGRSGNGSALNALYLETYALAYHPDLVIHLFYPLNDFRDDSIELTDAYVRQTGDAESRLGKIYPRFLPDGTFDGAALASDLERQKNERPQRSWLSEIARRSAFLAWLKQHSKELLLGWKSAPAANANSNALPVDQEIFLKTRAPLWQQAWATQEALLAYIKSRAESASAHYLLVSAVDGLRGDGFYREDPAWRPEAMDFDAPERGLAKIADKLGVTYLNLLPEFVAQREQTGWPSTFVCDGHWNENGHAWAAAAILNTLKQHPELLPKTAQSR